MKPLRTLLCLTALAATLHAQQRLIVVDQDAAGPGGSDMQSILLLLEAPQARVLGITICSGDVWAEEGLRHTRRMLELTGHADVPVYAGSQVPLIRTAAETKIQRGLYGKAWYEGAYTTAQTDPHPMREGEPTTPAPTEDAVSFLLRAVHEHPHQVTVFAGGPMTNLALAVRADPEFASLAKEFIFMGGSLNPVTDNPEFSLSPRHEFNLWFDPEAAHIVLTAPWPKITQTTVDISLQTRAAADPKQMLASYTTPAAKYMRQYGSESPYLWDELAVLAWLDPKIIRRQETLYVDVNLDHGIAYGDTLTWSAEGRPMTLALQPVHVQQELDYALFEREYRAVMSDAKTPAAK